MTCVKGVKAVLARTMFSLHALATLWRLVSQGKIPFSKLDKLIAISATNVFFTLRNMNLFQNLDMSNNQ